MGKAEQIKLERRLLEQKQKEIDNQKSYRNKIFLTGLGVGIAVGIIVMLPFALKKSGPATVPTVGGLSASPGASAVSLPTNLQLPQSSTNTAPLSLPK